MCNNKQQQKIHLRLSMCAFACQRDVCDVKWEKTKREYIPKPFDNFTEHIHRIKRSGY